MSDSVSLEGRVAIVTGAGSGLGRSHALALASRGAYVVATDIDGEKCRETADRIRDSGGAALAHAADLGKRREAGSVARIAIEARGRIDVLVNNAGLILDKTFHKQTLDAFEKVLRVNLLGSVYVTHACWPYMREQRYGRVVFTSSSSGLWGNFGQTNYAAAKSGLVGLMQTLTLEGDPVGIRVNTIAPFAQTPMAEGIFPESLHRFLKPEYVSAFVTYLSSEQCAVSGEVFEVGLGRIARVRIQRSVGKVLEDPSAAEAVADVMPRLMRQSADRDFANLFDDLEDFAAHCAP